MKFPFLPVSSFEDVTRDFEQIEGIFTGLSAARFGTATVTWDGVNDFTDQVTVPHGLPGTPAVVIATGNWEYADVAVGTFSLTATTFGVQGSVLGATPAAGSSIVYWLAIR